MLFLYIGLPVLLLIIGLCLFVGYYLWAYSIPTKKAKFKGVSNNDPTEANKDKFLNDNEQYLLSLNMEEIYIRAFDGIKLHAYYKEAKDKTNKTIISVHGWHGRALHTPGLFSHWLVDYNYNILFIDLRSYGKSEGEYTTFGNLDYKDLLSFINYLVDRYNGDINIALFGISMGGNTVSSCADKVPEQVKCIIDDCGFTRSDKEFKYLIKNNMHLPSCIVFFSRPWMKILSKFDLVESDAIKALKDSKVPVMFIHGSADTFVPSYMSKEKYEACSNKKEIHIFEGVKHARCYYLHKEVYKKYVLDFLVKYL